MDSSKKSLKEALPLAEKVQIEKETIIIEEKEEMIPPKTEEKPEEKSNEVPQERIERMKRAFRPTWIQDQINSNGKSSNGKKS
jgi:hypothetical protein